MVSYNQIRNVNSRTSNDKIERVAMYVSWNKNMLGKIVIENKVTEMMRQMIGRVRDDQQISGRLKSPTIIHLLELTSSDR